MERNYDKLVKELRYLDECINRINPTASGTFRKAADAIEELALGRDMYRIAMVVERNRAEKEHRWIPVKERLPDRGESVLVYRGGDNRVQPKTRIDVCPYLGDGIFCLLGVVYWMPLPEPPEEE